jgi:hypothetical protein
MKRRLLILRKLQTPNLQAPDKRLDPRARNGISVDSFGVWSSGVWNFRREPDIVYQPNAFEADRGETHAGGVFDVIDFEPVLAQRFGSGGGGR